MKRKQLLSGQFARSVCVGLAVALLAMGIGFAIGLQQQPALAEPAGREKSPIGKVVEEYQNSVVQITTYAEDWNPMIRQAVVQPQSYGSGTYIRQDGNTGYILTNFHVVEFGDTYTVLWYDGSTVEAKLVGYDNASDIAILSFEGDVPDGVKPLPLGRSSDLYVGEQIVVIGNPVTDQANTYALYDTVTVGHVSGLERAIDTSSAYTQSTSSLRAVKLIQVDASINGGVSGGALISLDGKLVGIPTIKVTSADNLGFCIAIDSVREYIDEIIETGTVSRPVLGIRCSDFDGPDEPMRRAAPRGVAVRAILEGGGAADSELKMYDIVTEVNGVRVFTVDDLTRQLALYQAGDAVELTVYRYYDEEGMWVGAPEEALHISVELRILEEQ